jgi:nickel-dependent lactate racemase
MQVKLDYGHQGLTVELSDRSQVIRSRYVPGVGDEAAAIRAALRNPINNVPLAEVVQPGDKVVIVHTDITRATPNDRLLPLILAEVEAAGVQKGDITLLNGLGTHRCQTEAELRGMLGDAIVDTYRCIQHDASDQANLVSLGVTSFGNPVRVNRAYLEADVRILTGFIEPHFFAGFSGGPKSVLPALAGFESVGSNHSVANVAHPQATWGVTAGNPIWDEMAEVAQMTNPDFLVNVTLNVDGQITAVFTGEMLAAHARGCAFVKSTAMIPVPQAFDIVITTNSGYPLDLNLYQSVKGMSAASRIVKQGGAIVCVAACEDGIPEPSGYADLLIRGGSPEGLLAMVNAPGFNEPDQWEVQIQALIQQRAEVYVYSDGLTDAQIEQALFKPCRDIPATLRVLEGRYGEGASIAVLPEGPQTVPSVRAG